MNSFNPTESQKDLLRLLVEKVRSGIAREPLLAIGMPVLNTYLAAPARLLLGTGPMELHQVQLDD